MCPSRAHEIRKENNDTARYVFVESQTGRGILKSSEKKKKKRRKKKKKKEGKRRRKKKKKKKRTIFL